MSAVLVFGSKAGGEVIMLRSHIEPLFQAMGRPLHDQSAILAEDLPFIIHEIEDLLEGKIVLDKSSTESLNESEDDLEEQKKTIVSMRTRFYPLLDLMRKASEKAEALHWRPL